MARYNCVITVFLLDDHLFQAGSCSKWNAAIGVSGKDTIVLGVEISLLPSFSRSVRKIVKLDDHIALDSAGVTSGACILINKARMKCQSNKYAVEDHTTVQYITHYVAGLQYKYTQSGVVRPFILSTLIMVYLKLTIRALFEVVENGGNNIKVAGMTKGTAITEEEEIYFLVAGNEEEKAATKAAKKAPARDA